MSVPSGVLAGGTSRDTVLIEVPPGGTACWDDDHDTWSPRRRRALYRGENR